MNEWGFRPPFCTCMLNILNDTTLQTQDSTFEHWGSEAEHATCRLRGLPTIPNLYQWARKKRLFLWNLNIRAGTNSWHFQVGSFNHWTSTRSPALLEEVGRRKETSFPPLIRLCGRFSGVKRMEQYSGQNCQEVIRSRLSFWFNWRICNVGIVAYLILTDTIVGFFTVT